MRMWLERFRARHHAETDRSWRLEARLRRERPRPEGSFVERARLALLLGAGSAEDRRRVRLRAWSLIATGLLLLIVAFVIAAS